MNILNRLRILLIATVLFVFSSCNRNKFEHDASGTFEATEVIVSGEGAGKIEEFKITEGDKFTKGQFIGYIDTTQLHLKKLQLQTAMKAVSSRRVDMSVQIAAVKEQIANAKIDKERVDNLFKDGAATQKMVDDTNSRLEVLKRNLAALQNSLSTSINSIDEEAAAYAIQVDQIKDQLAKCRIVNPLAGTVLNKFTEEKEMVTIGKPLYKVADTKHLFLRAYIISSQQSELKIGQSVNVYINTADNKQKLYSGTISWISDKAEFTPKTIQTQDERQNLVYAIKVEVENTDGLIKIGMYGDVDFK